METNVLIIKNITMSNFDEWKFNYQLPQKKVVSFKIKSLKPKSLTPKKCHYNSTKNQGICTIQISYAI